MAITLRQVMRKPFDVARQITREQFGVTLQVADRSRGMVAFDATFVPPTAFADEGYPIERVRIDIHAGGGLRTMPTGDARKWEHRNPEGDLCLWFEGDPRELCWEWDDGFDAYIPIAHRHLVYEEFYRREGYWPVEAAPHGRGDHPVIRLETKWKGLMWRR